MSAARVTDCKPSKAEILSGVVTDRLNAAALEILAVLQRTVAGYEEEAAGLRQEVERQRRQLELLLWPRVSLCRIDEEDSGNRGILGHAEEDEREDEEEESAEEPVQSTSPDQEDLRDPDHQMTKTRGQSVKVKQRRGGPLNLRVCLLQDCQTRVLKRGVSKSPMQDLRCPRGLQEPDFLDLLRSTFPQLDGQFDVLTSDASRKLTPLKVQTLTPEEIRRSIRSAGKGRSALYIRAKGEKKSSSDAEQLPAPQREDDDGGAASDTRNDENRKHERSPTQQMETEEEAERRGASHDLSAFSSARSAAEGDGVNGDDDGDVAEEDDRDNYWKLNRSDEAEPNSSKTAAGKRRGVRSEVKTKRRKPSSSNGDAPLSCKVCRVLRRSTNMMIKHAWSHVDDPERLCGVCGERSESSEELRSHLHRHQKTHSCNICGKSFLTAASRDQHTTLHTGERRHKCDICHKAFTHKTGLTTHRWEHAEEKPHKCDVCHQSFCFKQQLTLHSRTHTGEKPFHCDVCGKSVSDFRALSRHKLGHTGEKRYGCQVCGKRFLTPEKLKEHAKIHTEREKTHLCDVCCKVFHTRGQLKVHLKTHSEEKIACGECGKGLSSRSALRRHMFIHTGERPYECSECGRTFNCRNVLRAHLKIHSGVKQFVCSVCGKAHARKEYLKVHMRTHSGERPYQCAVCDKAFTQSHCLKTHMKSHQRDDKT